MNRLTCLVALVISWSLATVVAGEPAPRFGDNVQLRGSLDNCRRIFQTQKKGTVAFIGGSITEMDGYRPMVCQRLQNAFPRTKFTFIDAGISSTCSTTGAMRLKADVLDKGKVDLFFIEFAVNDDQDAHHTREECIRGLEGIIRHARLANPDMDIVVTFFVNEGMLAKLQKGETPLTIEAHEAVAKHYHVSTINLAREVAGEISAGKLTWKQYGGVHPAPFGNALCADMIDELFHRAWKAPLAQDGKIEPHAQPQPLDPFNYEHGRFIDPKEAKLISGFKIEIPDWKSLPGGKRDRFTSIPMLCGTQAGAEASLKFEGTCVGAYVVAGPDAGKIEASIDGQPGHVVDLYHPFSKDLHYPRTVLFGSDLQAGQHTLTIRVAKDSTSGGHAVRIMQFVAN